jgi:hypothetical protein
MRWHTVNHADLREPSVLRNKSSHRMNLPWLVSDVIGHALGWLVPDWRYAPGSLGLSELDGGGVTRDFDIKFY